MFNREQGFRRDPKDGQKEPTTADRVAELLASAPFQFGQEQLSEMIGVTDRTIREALKKLEADKKPTGTSRTAFLYALPDRNPSGSHPEGSQEELEWR